MEIKQILGRFKRLFSRFNPEEIRLRRIYKIFADSSEGGWIIGWKEARKIYHLIKIRNSKNALELGTGIGAAAAIMAFAMKENGRVTTIEQNKKCVGLAKKLIPEYLQKKINFVISEPNVFASPILKDGEKISGYAKLPLEQGPFDFVLVDGPGAFEKNGERVRHQNGDVFALVPHIIPGGIVFVDNRKKALALYLKYLSGYFTVGGSWRNYCILERTAKRLEER